MFENVAVGRRSVCVLGGGIEIKNKMTKENKVKR